jgi:bifunctional UDP-N-acetylglucosamine pyrophosphorylase/glucosamine-1-phosphate N-acetyltransferase
MQAVILCAGLGTRLRPLTLTTPKALIPIGNKTLIEHTLDALPDTINEIFLVVNYLGDQIKANIGDTYQGIPIRYVTQNLLNGTGGAIMLLQKQLHDRFLVVNGDDLYSRAALNEMLTHPTCIMLCPTDTHLLNGGNLDVNGKFIGLIESADTESYRICGAYVLDETYFKIKPVKIQGSEHEEYGLPQTIAVQATKFPINVVLTHEWYPVGTPEELKFVQEKLHFNQ